MGHVAIDDLYIVATLATALAACDLRPSPRSNPAVSGTEHPACRTCGRARRGRSATAARSQGRARLSSPMAGDLFGRASSVGDQLLLGFDDDKNEYRLSVDGGVPRGPAATRPGRCWKSQGWDRASASAAARAKVTESATLVRSFDGFLRTSGRKGAACAAAARPSDRIHRRFGHGRLRHSLRDPHLQRGRGPAADRQRRGSACAGRPCAGCRL